MARLNRGVVGGVLVLTFLLSALTGYVLFSGDDEAPATVPKNTGPSHSAAPESGSEQAPSYTQPDDWTEPDRWVALPRGKRTDYKGNEIQFEHTTEGAVAMLVLAHTASVEQGRSYADRQMDVFDAYLISDQKTPENEKALKESSADIDRRVRRELGVSEGEEIPEGAHLHSTVIGYKVVEASDGQVAVWLLARASVKRGQSEPEKVSYTRTITAAEWAFDVMGGDWKLSPDAIERAVRKGGGRPEIAAPGDARFNEAGWTAIRTAS